MRQVGTVTALSDVRRLIAAKYAMANRYSLSFAHAAARLAAAAEVPCPPLAWACDVVRS